MNLPKRLHLFQAYGVELEYMITDRETLDIKAVADLLLRDIAGYFTNEVVMGNVVVSNELVNHVIEIKCATPTSDLFELNFQFIKAIDEINKLLLPYNAQLMPGSMHPWMDPQKETELWPHGQREIYEAYDRIFNCKGHGWSNVQSSHLNLPFFDNEEFAALHAAVRILLPILPAISASSPIVDSGFSGFLDKRMDYYLRNQRKIPAATGKLIPERVYSRRAYSQRIFNTIAAQIKPYDPEGILEPVWVNSRGAIARFDRGSIEIRVLDIQESPRMDLAIHSLIIAVLKLLVKEHFQSLHEQQKVETDGLAGIFKQCIKYGPDTAISDHAFLKQYGYENVESTSANEIWKTLFRIVKELYPELINPWQNEIEHILLRGTLSQRILKALSGNYHHDNIKMVYCEMADCLAENQMLQPWAEDITL